MLATLKNLPIVGTLINNVQAVLIAAALILVSSAATGVYAYVKGYNAAALKCQVASVKRERDEAVRDRDNAVATSKFLDSKLTELQRKQDAREKKDLEDAANVKPIDGCVVPVLPARRVRSTRPKR